MLQIFIPGFEAYDELTGKIVTVKGRDLQLEHSLVSISKWESKWKKPFLGTQQKTRAETIDYVRCMTLTQNVDPRLYQGLTYDNIKTVNAYIDDPMTATTFKNKPRKSGNGSVITSEIIYFWMISLEIPVEFQKWHLNRLLTLIRVCDEKNQPSKKMSKRDVMGQYKSLNAARRSKYGTRG
jgi:hypothetical protein